MKNLKILILAIVFIITSYGHAQLIEATQLPGGELELYTYIASHLQYPGMERDNGFGGKVVVQFSVGDDSIPLNLTTITTPDKWSGYSSTGNSSPGLEHEAKRLISNLKFVPTKNFYQVPIVFSIEINHSFNYINTIAGKKIITDEQLVVIQHKNDSIAIEKNKRARVLWDSMQAVRQAYLEKQNAEAEAQWKAFCIKKFGIKFGTAVYENRVMIGMNTEMVQISWVFDSPERYATKTTTSTGTFYTWSNARGVVTFKNGLVTAITEY